MPSAHERHPLNIFIHNNTEILQQLALDMSIPIYKIIDCLPHIIETTNIYVLTVNELKKLISQHI